MPGSFAKHFLLICTDAKHFAIFCKGHQKVTPQQPWEAGTSLLPGALGKGWGRACAPEELLRDQAAWCSWWKNFCLRHSLILGLSQNLFAALLSHPSALPQFPHPKNHQYVLYLSL